MLLLLGAQLLAMSAPLPTESWAQTPDGVGAGMGFDVEYIAPQRFQDPGGDPERGLVVVIANQGEAAAAPSTTRIAFEGGEAFERPTPALAVGAEANVDPVPMPRGEGRGVHHHR